MVLAIFVVGMVPMAFAEKGDLDEKPKPMMKGEKKVKPIKTFREDKPPRPKAMEKVQTKIVKIKKEIAKEKLMQARERLEMAKEKFKEAKEKYAERKAKFQETKEQLQNCEGEECEELEAQALEHAKAWVINSGEMAIEHLEKLKERIESNEFYEEEDVAERLEAIEEKIAAIEALVEEAELAETKEELRRVAGEMAELWKGFKNKAKHYGNKLVNNQLRGLIFSVERLETVFECVQAEMEAEGFDTETVQDLLAQLDAKGAEAREAYITADEYLALAKEAREEGDKDGFKENSEKAKEYMNRTKKLIREAYGLVKELSKETSGNAHLMSCRANVAEGQVEVEEPYPVNAGDEEPYALNTT